MKLTDEQIDGIQRRSAYIEDNNLFDSHVINDIKQLLADRHAWKEEAKKWRAYSWTADEKLREKLNRALEVLKEIKSYIKVMQDTSESQALRHNMGNYAMHEIDKIVSSLSQEGGSHE